MIGKSNQNVVWGMLLILLGITALVDTFINVTIWAWVGVLVFSGLFAAMINWAERRNFVVFIPTYVLWAIAGLLIIISVDIFFDELIPVYVLWVIGFPFLIGYLRDKKQWGYLVPAYVLFSVGLMVGFIGLGLLRNFLIPAYVMLAVAFPFFVVYLINKENWWALIPSGIMATIAAGFLFASPVGKYVIPLGIIIIGVWIIARIIIRK